MPALPFRSLTGVGGSGAITLRKTPSCRICFGLPKGPSPHWNRALSAPPRAILGEFRGCVMSEMERVARDLCQADGYDPDAERYDEIREDYVAVWTLYTDDARAIVERGKGLSDE